MKREHERRFSAPDRAIHERLTDWTTTDRPTEVKNLRRMNGVLKWNNSEEELGEAVAELNEYIDRLQLVPIDVRRFIGAMAQRMRDTFAVHDEMFGVGWSSPREVVHRALSSMDAPLIASGFGD